MSQSIGHANSRKRQRQERSRLKMPMRFAKSKRTRSFEHGACWESFNPAATCSALLQARLKGGRCMAHHSCVIESIMAVTVLVGVGGPRPPGGAHWYRSRVRQHVATTAQRFPPNPAHERFGRDAFRTDCLSWCAIVPR